MKNLNKKEEKTINDIENTYYMKPILRVLDKNIDKNNLQTSWKSVFDNIYDILRQSKDYVNDKLLERQKNGEIKDVNQARKSVVGNAFSNLIVYIFLQNKINENIKNNVFITSKKSEIKNFDSIATIYVDGETQKPDVDLVIYSLAENDNIKKCAILSLKTSLRERAGQTYKWKLLMEIASTDSSIRDKYNITYNPSVVPLICFATVNFYDEINNPQHKGMFKFFDKSFIGKNIDSDFIGRLSTIVDFVNNDF